MLTSVVLVLGVLIFKDGASATPNKGEGLFNPDLFKAFLEFLNQSIDRDINFQTRMELNGTTGDYTVRIFAPIYVFSNVTLEENVFTALLRLPAGFILEASYSSQVTYILEECITEVKAAAGPTVTKVFSVIVLSCERTRLIGGRLVAENYLPQLSEALLAQADHFTLTKKVLQSSVLDLFQYLLSKSSFSDVPPTAGPRAVSSRTAPTYQPQ